MGLEARKPVFSGLRTTKAQTSLRIRAVWSAPLLFAYWKESYLNLLQAEFFNILANLRSWGDWFEFHFIGNSEDRFSRVTAHIRSESDITPCTLYIFKIKIILVVYKSNFALKSNLSTYRWLSYNQILSSKCLHLLIKRFWHCLHLPMSSFSHVIT